MSVTAATRRHFLALPAGALCKAGSGERRRVLFDFGARAPDLDQLKLEGLTASISRKAGTRALRLTSERKASFPSAILPSGDGHWNLARYRQLLFDVCNPGKEPITVMLCP